MVNVRPRTTIADDPAWSPRVKKVLGPGMHWPYGAQNPESQRKLIEWAETEKVRFSERGDCLHWIAKGRCGVSGSCREDRNLHRWMDHVTGWLHQSGNPALLVCQPYGLSLDDMQDLVAAAKKFELAVRVDGTGWYGYGSTWIELRPRDDEDDYDDEDEEEEVTRRPVVREPEDDDEEEEPPPQKPPQRSYAWDADEEDDDDSGRRLPSSDVFDLWRTIEGHQRAINMQKDLFEHWVHNSAELAKDWETFLSAGGVTAEDYKKYCEHRFRHRSTREKNHLRLVRKKDSPPIRVKARFKSGNDDAA